MHIEIMSHEGIEMILMENNPIHDEKRYIIECLGEHPGLKQKATSAKVYDDDGNMIRTVNV